MLHPLSPFLSILEASEFKLGVNDYQQIDLALSADGEWTLERLRDVLLVLVAKNQTQRDTFYVYLMIFLAQKPMPDTYKVSGI